MPSLQFCIAQISPISAFNFYLLPIDRFLFKLAVLANLSQLVIFVNFGIFDNMCVIVNYYNYVNYHSFGSFVIYVSYVTINVLVINNIFCISCVIYPFSAFCIIVPICLFTVFIILCVNKALVPNYLFNIRNTLNSFFIFIAYNVEKI